MRFMRCLKLRQPYGCFLFIAWHRMVSALQVNTTARYRTTQRRGMLMQAQGVGARLTRKEDDRFMRGRGQFVADIRLAGMKDVAFVRSPVAHARLHGVSAPDAVRGQVFTSADLVNVKGI